MWLKTVKAGVPHSYEYTIADQDGTVSARLDFKIKKTGLVESRIYSIKDLIGLYERAPDSKEDGKKSN